MSIDKRRDLLGPTLDAATGTERDLQIAQALADYLDRVSQQEFVDTDQFCLAHLEIEAELRPLLRSLNKMDELAETSIGPAPVAEDEPLPEKLSGHKILGVIGAGGMGRVLLGYDEGLGRRVAIKMLGSRYRDNESLRTRFMHEARALARISHPNIVQIFSLGQPSEPPHFVMELVEGSSLVDAAKPLTLPQRAELMRKVAVAVEFLHEHQILHRDLKPTNILVGADLQPRILDFGLARELDDPTRVTRPGEIMGTPDYFSPEHTTPGARLDPRSDVFSLGTIFYELLTGSLPFHAETFSEQAHLIRQEVPLLPRRINREIPGDLQNICLKALEKRPQDRYPSAKAMAEDLERFLAGEKVHASPTAYSGLMQGKIEQHMRELDGWREDRIISDPEYDSLRKSYGHLIERDDSWILNARRLSVPQVSLYLGAWILTVGAALMFLFEFQYLRGTAAVLVVGVVSAVTLRAGLRLWRDGQFRISIAYLLAFCLLLPIALLVIFSGYHFLDVVPEDKTSWELLGHVSPNFRHTTNAQIWWAVFLSLPTYFWLRRFTRSSVFSLVLSVMTGWLCIVTLMRMGLFEHFDGDPGWLYFRLIPIALLFFVVGILLERLELTNDSRYFYPLAVFFTFVSLSGLAASHEPYAHWLERTLPWTRGQIEYLFIINAAAYLVLQSVCEILSSPQMRVVAKAFRFAVPGHILTSVWLLGLEASNRWNHQRSDLGMRHEARVFEVLLPLLAAIFVYGSIWKQMKNYFVVGMLFLAIGVVRLQEDLFHTSRWPLFLIALGSIVMLVATRYSSVKMTLARLIRRRV